MVEVSRASDSTKRPTFHGAQRVAQSEGFPSVDAFVASAVTQRLVDHEFETPRWMLDELDKGIADLDAGRVISFEQYQAEMQRHREEWLARHA